MMSGNLPSELEFILEPIRFFQFSSPHRVIPASYENFQSEVLTRSRKEARHGKG